jgi:hypothetical protein
MEISCEPVNLSCVKPPTVSEINDIKTANIVPDSLIDKIFSGLASDYKELKRKTPTKSKSKSKSKKSISKSKTQGGKGKRSLKRRNMKGGALTEYQKNRITDIVILLVAGSGVAASAYWSIPTAIEAYIVSIGLLPKLCGQNMVENFVTNLASTFGSESCVARSTRYNTIVTGIIGLITAKGWFSPSMFYKKNLMVNYSKVHKLVKRTLFETSDPLTPTTIAKSPSPSRSPSRSRSRSRSSSRSPQAAAASASTKKRKASPKNSRTKNARSKSPTATGR